MTIRFLQSLTVFALVGFSAGPLQFATFAEDAPQTDLQDIAAELEEAAKEPEVEEQLAEPDGVSITDLDTDNWKIIAIGTGTYEFNDAEEQKDAVVEATLEAKAAMARFIKERLSSESQLDVLAERASNKAKENGATVTSATTKRMKTSLTSIKTSADEILNGVITLEASMDWDGDSGTARVKVGQSEKTLAAVKRFRERTTEAATAANPGASKAGNKSGGSGQPSTKRQKSKSDF